nr:MAG TPA: hypothetical protein [Bacteriophage sp.]
MSIVAGNFVYKLNEFQFIFVNPIISEAIVDRSPLP